MCEDKIERCERCGMESKDWRPVNLDESLRNGLSWRTVISDRLWMVGPSQVESKQVAGTYRVRRHGTTDGLGESIDEWKESVRTVYSVT